MIKLIFGLRNTVLKICIILLILSIALIPARYLNNIYGYLPFLSLIFLTLISLIYFFFMRKYISFKMESSDLRCARGENIDIILKILNRSILICPKVCANLYFSDICVGKETLMPKKFVMQGKSEMDFSFSMQMKHIGVYEAGLKDLRIYDPLGIFSMRISGNNTYSVTVLPKTCFIEEIALEDKLLTESQNLKNNKVNDGFEYTGVREYALGDPMKRIHWKLSAHCLGYMTKITEISKKRDLKVIIDFMVEPDHYDAVPDLYDCIVETALSLVEQARRKEIENSLVFMGQGDELIRSEIKGEQDYEDLVRQIPSFSMNSKMDILDGAGILERERNSSNRSTNIVLCTSRITEQLLEELINVKRQQRNPMFYYIMSSKLKNLEENDIKDRLRILSEYNIPYYLVQVVQIV